MNRLAIIGTALVVVFSYGLALAGDPRSGWLWCSLLKACG